MRSRLAWQGLAIFGVVYAVLPMPMQFHAHQPRDPQRWANRSWFQQTGGRLVAPIAEEYLPANKKKKKPGLAGKH